jgi:hypothetical protein
MDDEMVAEAARHVTHLFLAVVDACVDRGE